MLAAALGWAGCGRPVFPVGPDKRPRPGSRGLLDATTDEAKVRAWWDQWPNANIAIVTGEPSGLVALDADPRHGGDDSLHKLERQYGALPATRTVVTPSGGQHYWFTWPGVKIKTVAGEIAPGIDIRGDGGYALVPPSRTPHGSYEHDSEAPLAPMPVWLVDLARDDRNDGERHATPPDV
jgi:putative DNA primase/helicase